MEGKELIKRILDRRLTKCMSTGEHYPFERGPLFVDLRTLFATPKPPMPSNCARCGIGGPYRIFFDNSGSPIVAEVINVG